MSQQTRLARRNRIIEHLAATGMPIKEIASQVNLSERTVAAMLRQPESVVRVEALNKQICERVVSEAAGIGVMFDAEAPHAFQTLRRLNRGVSDDIANPVPHAVSYQAAKEILDRAPSVPLKKGERESDKHLHIHLPKRQYDNAQQALTDVGLKLDVVEDEREDS